MPKTPETKPETEPNDRDLEKEDSWEVDQEKRGYYYDDAHGYEVYVPEKDEDDSSAQSSSFSSSSSSEKAS